MTDESGTQKISKEESAQNSLSKDEIDQLSDIISDCMATETLGNEQDTGPFGAAKDDDTGEFEPIKTDD